MPEACGESGGNLDSGEEKLMVIEVGPVPRFRLAAAI